jgi:hypothetical protein
VADEPNLLTLDVAGASALPGLIDPHVHLSVVPRRSGRSAALRDAPAQLCAYLAFCVTTVLDTGIEPRSPHELQTRSREARVGPPRSSSALLLGAGATAPTALPSETPEQVRKQSRVPQS